MKKLKHGLRVVTTSVLVGLLAFSLPMPISAHDGATATPIEHLVVIFQENVSFDHYFATYPNATNPHGEPAFHARPNTPNVNGLSGALLTK